MWLRSGDEMVKIRLFRLRFCWSAETVYPRDALVEDQASVSATSMLKHSHLRK